MVYMRDHWGGEARFHNRPDKQGAVAEADRDLRVWVRAYADEYGVRVQFVDAELTPQEIEEAARRRRFIADGGLCP
jgi:hypothetical protein